MLVVSRERVRIDGLCKMICPKSPCRKELRAISFHPLARSLTNLGFNHVDLGRVHRRNQGSLCHSQVESGRNFMAPSTNVSRMVEILTMRLHNQLFNADFERGLWIWGELIGGETCRKELQRWLEPAVRLLLHAGRQIQSSPTLQVQHAPGTSDWTGQEWCGWKLQLYYAAVASYHVPSPFSSGRSYPWPHPSLPSFPSPRSPTRSFHL